MKILKNLTKSELLSIVSFLILLIAIPLTLILVKQQQILKSRADASSAIQFLGVDNSTDPPSTTSQNVQLRLTYAPVVVPTPAQTQTITGGVFVWNDINSNNQIDNGELVPYTQSLTVNLSPCTSTTTNSSGTFTFTNPACTSNLRINLTPPAGFQVIGGRFIQGSTDTPSIPSTFNLPPAVTVFFVIKQATAIVSSPSPTPYQTTSAIRVAILQDGYGGNLTQYHQDAQTVISAIQNTDPFTSSFFDFRIVDNAENFQCSTRGIAPRPGPYGMISGCIQSADMITGVGLGYRPDATKFIVLVQSSNPLNGVGMTNDLGGNLSIFMNRPPDGITLGQLAIHEFLGHSVSELYDRYTKPASLGVNRDIRSNCTDNPSGEAFWRAAGVTGAYPGCDGLLLYGSSPASCQVPVPPPPPGYPPLPPQSAATNTVMSTNSCAPGVSAFDPVEKAWIRNTIIPRYQRP